MIDCNNTETIRRPDKYIKTFTIYINPYIEENIVIDVNLDLKKERKREMFYNLNKKYQGR